MIFFSLSLFREKAGVELDGGSYLIHKIYDDEETLRLVAASCETLGMHFSKLFTLSPYIKYSTYLMSCFEVDRGRINCNIP